MVNRKDQLGIYVGLLWIILSVLVGCAQQVHQQKATIPTVHVNLRVGVTTKAEVLNTLGAPNTAQIGMIGAGIQGEQLVYVFYPSAYPTRRPELAPQPKIVVARIIAQDGTAYESMKEALTLHFVNGVLQAVY